MILKANNRQARQRAALTPKLLLPRERDLQGVQAGPERSRRGVSAIPRSSPLPLRFFLPLPLPLLLLLAPMALAGQSSSELVQAKTRLIGLNREVVALDERYDRELEAALAREVDLHPRGEFETMAEDGARIDGAEAIRRRLKAEFERKKANRRQAIDQKIETLIGRPYEAPIRIRLGTYDADSETFPFSVRTTGSKGTIPIPQAIAALVKRELPTLKQLGYWQLSRDGTGQLLVVAVHYQPEIHLGTVRRAPRLKATLIHSDIIFAVAFGPDGEAPSTTAFGGAKAGSGQVLASGGKDQHINLWRVADGTLLHTLAGHTGWVKSLAFSPDGQILASGGDDQTIRLWRVADGQPLHTLTGHTGGLLALAFSPTGTTPFTGLRQGSAERSGRVPSTNSGQVLASGSWDHTIKLWRVSDGQLLQTLSGGTKEVIATAFSPDGQTLISVSGDQTIRLWRLSDGQRLNTITGRNGPIHAVAFSPDPPVGGTMATGGGYDAVKLWRLDDGKRLRDLIDHMGWVLALAFSPDGGTLASGSHDQTVKLWAVDQGTVQYTLRRHVAAVMSVAFSPDGRFLASGSSDHSIKLWRVYPEVDEPFLADIRDRIGASPPQGR